LVSDGSGDLWGMAFLLSSMEVEGFYRRYEREIVPPPD
jgi:hypothetical protein